MPIFLEDGSKPVAIVRVGQIHTDCQTRGFFSIGVLPMLVLDGLSFELCDQAQLSAALGGASANFGSMGRQAAKVVEGRDFSLFLPGQKHCVLHVQVARLESGTQWSLQEGTLYQPGASAIFFGRAVLAIAGPKAGELTYDTPHGPAQIRLLSLVTNKDRKDTTP